MQSKLLTLGSEQRIARDRVCQWWQDPNRSQVFKLFGYAGTGKTTLTQSIIRELGVFNVRYAAFSGKAAYVMQQKGCEEATTIHKLIYRPVMVERRKGQWVPAEPLRFELNPDSDLAYADLLVLDEVSMVSASLAEDLLGFGVPILCLGDPAQLPPVGAGGYFMEDDPDALLTEVHRSALESPVTRLAMQVRQASDSDPNSGIQNGQRIDFPSAAEIINTYDQVIVGTNGMRHHVTAMLRAELFGDPTVPLQDGERIIILKNNRQLGVYNGMQFTVEDVLKIDQDDNVLIVRATDDEGDTRDLRIASSEDAPWNRDVAVATFAYAITCHKAQGSQWDNVLVADESKTFLAMQRDACRAREMARQEARKQAITVARQWLYTAVTRAAKHVDIARAPRG